MLSFPIFFSLLRMVKTLSFDKRKIRVLLLEGVHPAAADMLRADGYSAIQSIDRALSENELITAIGGVHVLGIRSRTQLSAQVFERATKLVTVGCYCIGTNQVDTHSAKMHGIPVFNAPFSNTRSVAELVIGHIIYLQRDIPAKNAAAHRGLWLKSAKGSYEVRGKTLGIVGYGHIGTQVGILAEALGMDVLYFDTQRKLGIGNAKDAGSLKVLLERSDIVTLHVPEDRSTQHMIDARAMSDMKPGAKLINAARGKVVDIDALVDALKSKHIGGAAIDVFPREPKAADEEFVSSLRTFDNVILTPHIGGSTMEAQENISREVTDRLLTYVNSGSTVAAVNFVEVHLQPLEGKHRILHIHRNTPGVLTAINEVFSQAGINVAGQYLRTDSDIGYVVIDVDEAASKVALEKIKAIPATIKARVLY